MKQGAKKRVGGKRERNLFAELREGVEALAGERSGGGTLRAHAVEFRPAPRLTAREIVDLREALDVRARSSRPVCAPTCGPSRTGSRGALAPTRRRRC